MIGALVTPAIYRGISRLAAPAIDIWLARRRRQGKEDKARFAERLGHAGRARPEGRLAWAHAASIGEALAVLPLAERLEAQGLNVLITSGTVTSAGILEQRLPAGMIHQYVPIDRPAPVRRFLDHWRPDAAIWVESELWPNLVLATSARAIPMVMVNARMSERSARRWRRMPRLIAPLLGAFDICLAQSEEDGRRLRALGAPSVSLVGNIKYDAPPLPVDEAALHNLRRQIGERPHWLAASTHPGEEAAAAEAHAALGETIPGLLTVIAPRHPGRGAEIAELLGAGGIGVARRSTGDRIDAATGFYIADTLGEMGLLYRLAGPVFVAGSLTTHGGHNPVEPALLKNALVAGPDMRNFEDSCRALAEAGALGRIPRANALAGALEPLLRDAALSRERGEAAYSAARALGGASDLALAEILRLLDSDRERAHAHA
ncbi:MAG: glycosyltransferase N-terminal domain-containing protein [Alphaproteobacteria bacterium]|jgi:3-deoxy-D-manno-octulosonic-acid transferase|nr:glycosyltransferase N-terminal domain-containing protein [Alphaproteobacteria bacterium]MDP6588338.1 glycosyltransferase N-terminal domain-containing protein [Alphaproteobacteria bacterium]MDP6816838.1 glycosyltransferase N-terminal domain-containing protein [Alphaproteobacteria bacterium]